MSFFSVIVMFFPGKFSLNSIAIFSLFSPKSSLAPCDPSWPTTMPSGYLSCIQRKYLNMNESDPRSDVHYLGSSENKA